MDAQESRPSTASAAPQNDLLGSPPVKLSVENVSKTFRTRDANSGEQRLLAVLRHVSFDVKQGEIVSIVGESGSGKTTLLRIIQGLIRNDSGHVQIDGEMVTEAGRDRGFVFQQATLLPWRSVRDNVEFGLEFLGMARKKRTERARTLLNLVGLESSGEQYPHQLSGGMQQRVGLARALAIDPAILLMDEPFSALDAQTREVLQSELLRIQSQTGKTILFVTHDLDEAIYLSNRIIVLAARPGRVGRIIEVPFPYPREGLSEMRGDLEFQRIRSEISQLIGKSSRLVHRSEDQAGLVSAQNTHDDDRRTSGKGASTLDAAQTDSSDIEDVEPPVSSQARFWLFRLISIVAVLGGWEIVGRRVNPLFMSYPSAITRAAARLVKSGELFAALESSLEVLLLGFAIAAIIGVALGLLIGRYRSMEAATDWLVNALYATPLVAIVPLVTLWFGLGVAAKLFIIAVLAVFPVLINTVAGVRNVPASLIDVGAAFAAKEHQVFVKIILPSAIPFMMTGLRLGVGRAIIGMVVAEFFTAITGLGALIVKYGNQYDTASMFVPILVLMLLGVLSTYLLRRAEQAVAPWRSSEE